jgi:hypothetical protein
MMAVGFLRIKIKKLKLLSNEKKNGIASLLYNVDWMVYGLQ